MGFFGKPPNARTQIRVAFGIAVVFLILMVVFYAFYAIRFERTTKWHRLHNLVSLVAETSQLYFDKYNTGFFTLGEELYHIGPSDPVALAHAMRVFTQVYPNLRDIMISGPHDHIWILPPTQSEIYRDFFSVSRCGRDQLRFGLTVGRPRRLFGEHFRVIPLCYGLRVRGHLALKIYAVLPLRAQQALWRHLFLPAGAVVGLVQTSGHFQSRWPLESRGVYENSVPNVWRHILLVHSQYGRYEHDVVIPNIGHARFGVYERVQNYPWLAFISLPFSTVLVGWWHLIFIPVFMLFTVLIVIYGVYRWAIKRQQMWEEQRRQNESDIYNAKERVEVTLRSIIDAVVATDINGRVQYLNSTAERITGWAEKDALGQLLNDICPCLDAQTGALLDPISQCLAHKTIGPEDVLLLHRDGHALTIERTTAPIYGRDGSITGVVFAFHDVTEKRLLTEQLSYQATHDSLTGLPNRALFGSRLEQVITEASYQCRHVALLFLDLDGFKRVNDTLGHAVGDQVLKNVAQRLLRVVRTTDTLARLGGDEFAVVLPGIKEHYEVLPIVRKLISVFTQSVLKEPEEIFLSASIGVALYPADGRDVLGLSKAADTAMYEAKAAGKNTYRFFKLSMRDKNAHRLSLEAHLHRGLERGEFFLLYQPQIRIADHTVVGMEALVRWQHPVRGIIYPAQFIPLAEESGFILPLGAWIFRAACDQARKWCEAGLVRVPVGVNITARQCRHEETPGLIRQVLARTELAPANLVLELAESLALKKQTNVRAMMKTMKDMGVGIVVGNFGAGFSSLSYIQQLPVDAVKMDRSLIRNVPGDPSNEAVIHAVIGLAHTLGLQVVAEGVETEAQYEFLRSARCDVAQGYYLAPPLGAVAAGHFLAAYLGQGGVDSG